jgi:poly(hydroxyalkanoate) depolymerase family esterase
LGPFTPAKRSSLRSPTVSGDRRNVRQPLPEKLINKDSTMGTDFGTAMRQALQLVRLQNVSEATRVIQRALAERGGDASPVGDPRERVMIPPPSSEIIGTAETVKPAPQPAQERAAGAGEAAMRPQPSGRARRPLGEAVKLLRQAELLGLRRGPAQLPGLRKAPTVAVPEGAAYLARSFACAAGSRDYKVYVPSGVKARRLPLIVMLHGCTQNPDDFAVGTGMNRLAEERGFIVAYPEQPASANLSACWNWFHVAHQTRGEGEPAILAGVTRAVMAEFAVDPARVYVAGLSAGGAMAAVLSATYPELYAAAGVHSGLAHGAAADLPSALAAMRGSKTPPAPGTRLAKGRVRTIVFHGANDKMVHPSNATAILADARAGLADPAQESILDGAAAGRTYRRTLFVDDRGVPQAEHWVIDGLGHAWSGGSPEGSFTDARGPDASREMLRFFLATQAE